MIAVEIARSVQDDGTVTVGVPRLSVSVEADGETLILCFVPEDSEEHIHFGTDHAGIVRFAAVLTAALRESTRLRKLRKPS